MLQRALNVTPLGTQTFSKSYTQFPRGAAPFFIQRAQGSRVWDIDGNEYLDFSNSLTAITLGHNDPDVTAAVRAQLDEGVIFPLAHPIEVACAEAITQMVPCADMVRFGKNGSDATAGAIRLARAWTNRDHIIVCGYHGWQDWYIGSTSRSRGVPQATRDLTHSVPYNDPEAVDAVFREYPGNVAGIILEPMNVAWPRSGYLDELKALVHRHGGLLVFDEVITGFRFANGGAQEAFGVIPDLCALGKGIANGYPLSAVAGRGDVMKLLEEVFFSFTMGGEALSLAAATATLEKLRREPVTDTLARRGTSLITQVQALIDGHGVGAFITLSGHPSWSFLLMREYNGYESTDIKTLFLQEIFARGVLNVGTHNMSYAHSESDVSRLVEIYNEVFPLLRTAVVEGNLKQMLKCEPLKPLFMVR